MKSALKITSILLCLLCINTIAFARPDNRSYISEVTPAIWVNPQNIKVHIYPDENKGYIFTNSFKIWDNALSSNINFYYVNNPEEADITIKYVDVLEGSRMGVTQTAHMQIQGKLYLGKANILIQKKTFSGINRSDTELAKTTLHEIGHALGILGHSDSKDDIMYWTTETRRSSTLSPNDIRTVEKMYGF